MFVDESNTGYSCIFLQETWPPRLQTNVLLSFNVLFIRLKHLYVSSLSPALVQIYDKYLRLDSLPSLYLNLN